MGAIKHPPKAKLIAAVMVNDLKLFPAVKQVLQTSFGPTDLESDVFSFTFTDYYAEEMGTELYKQILSFGRLMDKSELAPKKLRANEIEEQFAIRNAQGLHRCVNIDPGYVTDSKLVLASTKNFSHRLYIGGGVFAEVTLRYHRTAGFEPLEWTYPDYRTDLVRAFLELVRQRYMEQLRGNG
ncbi:MAG: DUF4416 family protein [bacterium]